MKKSQRDYVRCIPHCALFRRENNHLKLMLVLVFVATSIQVLAAKPFAAFNVSGRVSDETGQPLPGVNILEKGTTNGTTTDSNGAYQMAVSDENSTLVFSFIGYTTQEIPIGNRAVIDIKLAPDTQSLTEVVVVGYGSQLKKEITGSVQTVTAKDLKDLPVSQVTQKLQGRLAGVQINQATGKPALGFASQPYDWFAFLEDPNATGMVGVKTSTRATSNNQIS